MKNAIKNRELIGDVLLGRFQPHPTTQENTILVRLADNADYPARDFCILEKTDCSSQSDTSQNSQSTNTLECPDLNKNKKCGKFEWEEIGFEEDGLARKFCFAKNTGKSDTDPISGPPLNDALHDSNSCGDYGATRLWFRKSNGEIMFEKMIDQLSTGNNLLLH